eukprot:226124_1
MEIIHTNSGHINVSNIVHFTFITQIKLPLRFATLITVVTLLEIVLFALIIPPLVIMLKTMTVVMACIATMINHSSFGDDVTEMKKRVSCIEDDGSNIKAMSSERDESDTIDGTKSQ